MPLKYTCHSSKGRREVGAGGNTVDSLNERIDKKTVDGAQQEQEKRCGTLIESLSRGVLEPDSCLINRLLGLCGAPQVPCVGPRGLCGAITASPLSLRHRLQLRPVSPTPYIW